VFPAIFQGIWEGRAGRSRGGLFAVLSYEGEEQVCEDEDEEGDGECAMFEVYERAACKEAEGGGDDGVVYAAGLRGCGAGAPFEAAFCEAEAKGGAHGGELYLREAEEFEGDCVALCDEDEVVFCVDVAADFGPGEDVAGAVATEDFESSGEDFNARGDVAGEVGQGEYEEDGGAEAERGEELEGGGEVEAGSGEVKEEGEGEACDSGGDEVEPDGAGDVRLEFVGFFGRYLDIGEGSVALRIGVRHVLVFQQLFVRVFMGTWGGGGNECRIRGGSI